MARLTQIVDISHLIALQKRLTNALGMSVVFEEANGSLLNVIGERGGVCKACTEFIDKEETGRKKCLASDSYAAWKAQGSLLTGRVQDTIVEFYICNGRLRNFVIPISIGGEVIGNVFSGQFLVQTLTKQDPDLDKIISRMEELGVAREEALIYASMPEEEDILQIARDNNIPTEHWPAFQTTYKEMFKNAKPLSYVVNAVYLLSEVAQTLSALGNAYYYNDIYTKLASIADEQLMATLTEKLEELNSLVQTIKSQPRAEMSTEIAGMNQLINEILLDAESYESSYIRDLLSPYSECLASVPPKILELQKRLLIAWTSYDSRRVRTILNKALRDKTLSPRLYCSEDKKLIDDFNSQLKEIEDVLSEEPTTILDLIDREPEILRTELLEKIKNKLINGEPTPVHPKATLDDIENLLILLNSVDFGLQRIRNELCEERVLNELPMPVAALRRKLRLGYNVVYLNWGGISSSMTSAVEELNLLSSEIDQHGPVSVFSEKKLQSPIVSENILSSVRETVANLVRCEADEVVLTHNTTHGITLALSSVDFSPKGQGDPDRILITNCEHDTILHCIEQIEKKFNVKHETVSLFGNASGDSIIDDIVSRSSDGRTKIIILSHVTFNTGKILSIADIIQKVSDILTDKTPLFLIDGAQAVGHIPVDVSALNCDFYAADAHKWLMGPRGSGFLYVKESYLKKHSNNFDFYENYMVAEEYRPRYEERGRVYEPATMSVETYVAMKNAIETIIETHDKFPELYERITSLSQMFVQLIESTLQSYGVQLINHSSETGLVTISFPSQDNFEFYDEIRKNLDQRFHVLARALDNPSCLRFSISYLNSEWELNFAVKAIEKLVQEIPSLAETKASVDQRQVTLLLQKNRVSQNIKTILTEAKSVLSTRHEESKRKLKDIQKITRSKDIYEETITELDQKVQEFLGQVEKSVSAEELEELERQAANDINIMIYGEHD